MSDATISAHGRQFAKVLDLADVIIQVLDARDPLGSRSRVVEDHIRMAGPDKKMVLVLNKIGMDTLHRARRWLLLTCPYQIWYPSRTHSHGFVTSAMTTPPSRSLLVHHAREIQQPSPQPTFSPSSKATATLTHP